MFVGIVLIENNNYVLEAEDPAFGDLVHHRLVLVDDLATGVATSGVVNPGFRLGTAQHRLQSERRFFHGMVEQSCAHHEQARTKSSLRLHPS